MIPKNKFSKSKEEYIINLYNSGKSQKEIANLLNTYNTSIRRVLLRNNIKLRSNSYIQSFVKENPFINKLHSKYFLGLLLSDGCISNSNIFLSLNVKEYYLLEQFAIFLGDKVKVNKYFSKNHNKYQYYVKFRSKLIEKYLKTLACFDNKSKNLELYIPINYELLRGIFDGDGSVIYTNNKQSLRWFICTASEKFANQLFQFLIEENYNPTITNYRGIFYVNLYRKNELNILFGNLYKDTDMFLYRKHNRWATFLGKPIKKNNLNSGKVVSPTLSEA